MGRITWTPDAVRDLNAITDYIAESSPDTASDFAERLGRAVRHLEQFPRIGRPVPELDSDELREVVFKRYRIVYEIRDDGVWILALMHGSQDFSRLAQRRGWNLS